MMEHNVDRHTPIAVLSLLSPYKLFIITHMEATGIAAVPIATPDKIGSVIK